MDPESLSPLAKGSLNAWYIDATYMRFIAKPLRPLSMLLWAIIDEIIIGLMIITIVISIGVEAIGGILRRMQSGIVNSYVLILLFGAIYMLWLLAWPGWLG